MTRTDKVNEKFKELRKLMAEIADEQGSKGSKKFYEQYQRVAGELTQTEQKFYSLICKAELEMHNRE